MGATRDLLVQRVPAVFGGNGLYASVAALVAALQVICSASGVPVVVATPVAVVAGTALRLVAYRRGWELPGGMEREARDVLGKAVHPPRPRQERRRDRRPDRRRDRHGDQRPDQHGDRRRDEGD
ncbi:hypothetical protein AB0L05_12795 [Nonomuraea pusilla]|uniref:hypothetical protein n=1 Tax=Nonomuraea pusilla TaxID=46177 RepID=UPI003319C329